MKHAFSSKIQRKEMFPRKCFDNSFFLPITSQLWIIFTRVMVMASFNWTLITVQLLCNWVISSMFSLNKSSLFLTPLRVYLSANPLFCRFRVFSLFDLREGVWLADVYECPPVSQTEIVKLLRLSKMERNSASKRSIRRFVVTEKAPTRAFSWLKAATTAFKFMTLLRHYAK